MKVEEASAEYVFAYVEIRSAYLRKLLGRVLAILGESLDLDEVGFGPLHEEPTLSGEVAEVTEFGQINIDSDKLKQEDDDVAMATIAHELAHHYLKHHLDAECGLECEDEADALAKQWGFDIDKMRAVCGAATLQAPRVTT